MPSSLRLNVQLPDCAAPLFKPKRYKSLRGGRGSAKSWTVAQTLALLGMQKPKRILCARETQSSIRDSVHKLLSDRMQAMGLAGAFYHPEVRTITAPNGTEFLFAGLSDQTAESLKSFEGVDIVWVEEGQVTSQRSWDILIPTIRKDDSEIWVTWNPELDTDPTWKLLVENKGDDVLDIEMNWRDNPWFSDVLNKERLKAKATMSEADYNNIWEGMPRPAVTGAIYAEEVAKLYSQNRVGAFGHDPFLLTHLVFDLGWNDSMFIGFVQRVASSIRVIDCIEDDHKTLSWYNQEIRKRSYNFGTVYLPHDGDHDDYKTGTSARKIMEGLGWTVEVLPNLPITEGIRAGRMAFEQAYINKETCAPLLECLKRYRRSIPNTTGEPGAPVHDKYSHGADMWRYTALAAPMMTNGQEMKLPPLKYPKAGIP